MLGMGVSPPCQVMIQLEEARCGICRNKDDVRRGQKSDKENERYFGHYLAVSTAALTAADMGRSKFAEGIPLGVTAKGREVLPNCNHYCPNKRSLCTVRSGSR